MSLKRNAAVRVIIGEIALVPGSAKLEIQAIRFKLLKQLYYIVNL